MEVLTGQVLVGEFWNLDVYDKKKNGKGLQHQIFLDNEPFTSKRVLLFKFQPCLSPFVL